MLLSGINPYAKNQIPESDKRVIIVTPKTMARYGITKLMEKIAAELQKFAPETTPSTSGRGKKFDDYAKRLRVLGYCRLRSTRGQNAADVYLASIHAKQKRVSIRDWDSAKTYLKEELHNLFPFIPVDETPIHGVTHLVSPSE